MQKVSSITSKALQGHQVHRVVLASILHELQNGLFVISVSCSAENYIFKALLQVM